MATHRQQLWLLLGCSVVLLSYVDGMMPGMGMGMDEGPKAAAVLTDIPYIKCAVCEAIVKQATRKVKAMRSELKPGQRLHEDVIIGYLETMCDPYKSSGSWITHYDIVEDGETLKLIDTQKVSKCNTECATVARACSQLSDKLDLSDFSEALFAGKSRSALTQLACYEMSNACKVKPPPVPKDRQPGPAHLPMSAEEAQQQDMMQRLKAAGLKGDMFNREAIAQQLKGMQAATADDDEIPTDLLKGVKAKRKTLADVKSDSVADSVVETVAKAGEAVQELAGKAMDVVQDVVGKATSFVKSFSSKNLGNQAEL